MAIFRRRTRLAAPVEQVFDWHARPGALSRLTPPWEPMSAVGQKGTVGDGDWARLKIGPLPYLARHRAYRRPELGQSGQFQDVQALGPFGEWLHLHRFRGLAEDQAELEDLIEFRLPLGRLGRLGAPIAEPLIAARLGRMFDYRGRVLSADLAAHLDYGGPPMRILISGASGLIGSALAPFLSTGGHTVLSLVRRPARGDHEIAWFPDQGSIESERLEGLDAVIHLAGENIAGQRWDEDFKQKALASRVKGTRLLARALCQLKAPPKVLISASAIGYYGDRGQSLVNEADGPGAGFLSEVCQAWEAEAEPVEACGIRLVKARIGVVMTPGGGALGQMLLPFKLGLGGPVGDGKQIMSWISLDDTVRALWHCVHHEALRGPVNLVAPHPVSSRVFGSTLGRVLHRPALIPMPAVALKLALGPEMAQEILLASTRVEPKALLDAGFSFQFPELEPALRHMLGKA